MLRGNPGDQAPVLESNAGLDSGSYSLQKFNLYETQSKYYLIGRDKNRLRWRVLKIDRSEPAELNIYEDPAIYTRQECNEFLSRLAEGNRASGGLNFVTKAYGIVGFVKFLEPYYMIIITKRKLLGSICGHSIYGISESQLVTVPHSSVLTSLTNSKAESRYKRLFNSIDLSRNFFYSYTYRIMWSLQRNAIANKYENVPYDDMFVWNSFLSRKLRTQVRNDLWTVAIVHGYFKQVQLVCESKDFSITLVARRSRHYAGTRYLKRGVNAKGRVANDVETEQLVSEDETGQISSIVQHRGSIPLYWSQDTSMLSLKPDIKLHRNDPTYEATGLHFQNLAARYGNPIVVLNLVKTVEKRPRETILCREYASAVAYLNHHLPKADRIKFIQLDFHLFLKRKSHNMLEVLESIASDVLDLVGFYYSGKPSGGSSALEGALNGLKNLVTEQQPVKRMFQHGILRTNCIDCLDRTNVAQYAFGLAALGMQVLGLSSSFVHGWNSSLAITMMELYENMGDVLALQYGGSTAHNKVFSKWQGKWDATIQSQEFFRSLVRHYNNALLDGEKQDAINIFLGHFRSESSKLALWQLDSDNHLQFRRGGADPTSDLRLSFKRSFSAEDMLDKDDVANVLSQAALRTESNLNKSSLKKQLVNMDKRGVTISEAELKKCLASEDGFMSFSDVRQNRTDPSLLSLYSSLYRSADTVRCLRDCADADWLSSSGNSCEEDAQERCLVTATGSDNWQGSGLLTDIFKKSEESDDPDDNFQDLTALLMRAKSFKLNDNVFFKGQSKESMCSYSGDETGSLDGTVKSEGAPDSEELFSERFVNWMQEDHVLCF